MKIGIITFHRAHNYGALLQCYALKKYLESQTHCVDIIDYWPRYHANRYALLPDFYSQRLFGKIFKIAWFLMGFSKFIRRSNRYKSFMINHLDISSKIAYNFDSELSDINYDAIIYGSDQIWWKGKFPNFEGYDFVYWGDYVPNTKKKITYAASMGAINIKENEVEVLKSKLTNFAAITVREQDLLEKIQGMTNISVKHVLDPVFLLTEEEWVQQLLKEKFSNSKANYVLYYQMKVSEDALLLANQIASSLNYKIVDIRNRVNPLLIGRRYHQTASTMEFLHLLKNAKYVVTSSFHGMAFSIIFKKQFFVMGMANRKSRAISLLQLLGIPERYLDNISDVNFKDKIDYIEVTKKLEAERQASIEILKNALSLEIGNV